MANTRKQFRTAVGKALPRGYYAEGTTDAGTTADQIKDADRVEHDAYWDGASLLVGGNERIVQGGSAKGNLLFLEVALASAPVDGSAYELVKGFTFAQFNEAIDRAHERSYPQLYNAIDDKTTVSETKDVLEYTLNDAWRDITMVLREIEGSSPARFRGILAPSDYDLIQTNTGLKFFTKYQPTKTGLKLWFVGKGLMTIGAADTATSLAPIELIKHGALWWLYENHPPDELLSGQRHEAEANKHLQLFEKLKLEVPMLRQPRRARTPRLTWISTRGTTA